VPYLIRKANKSDVPSLGQLLEAYMRETYHGAWGGNVELLEQHLLGNELEIIVAETLNREVVGFVAWVDSYDLHWCLKGGDVIDFFVRPSHRGRGAAILLISKLAGNIRERGGAYLKGGAVDDPVVRRLYRKIAIRFPGGESYISGRAFRRLAELSGESLRGIIRKMPEAAWNYEP
jgi:GNAT superfamily N-acetyltransferase